MTCTFDLVDVTDNTRVRYHIQDTDCTAAMFSDEEIAFVIAEEGTFEKATISLIRATIAKLSREPDLTADWLKIDWRRSIAAWEKLLADKTVELGVTIKRTGRGLATFRGDSLATEPPDFD